MIMYWSFNTYLFLYSNITSKWILYPLSFFFAYFSNIFKIIFGIDPTQLRGDVVQYMLFPLITVLALNSIILIILNSIIQEEERRKADQRITTLQLENLKAQKQTLTQQLQPHFLFNALSILKSLIYDDKAMAEKYVVQLSNFLRYSVDSHNSDLVTIAEEMKFVNDYVNLQQIRFEDSFTFKVAIDEAILERKVPVLAIQTLVENAFKHNYFTPKNPMQISIYHTKTALTISNNLTSLKLTERNGTGLENLKKRYALFGSAEVLIQQTDNHFSVSIPIIDV